MQDLQNVSFKVKTIQKIYNTIEILNNIHVLYVECTVQIIVGHTFITSAMRFSIRVFEILPVYVTMIFAIYQVTYLSSHLLVDNA